MFFLLHFYIFSISKLPGPLPDFMKQEMDKIYNELNLEKLKLDLASNDD